MRIISKAVGPYGTGQIADYTREINVIPNQWGLIQELGIFMPEPVAVTTVIIDQVENTLVVLPEVPRGGPASRAAGETVKQLPLIIPHIPHSDQLLPEDVQDRRMPGSTGPDTATRKRIQKMEYLRRRQALTLEFLRMGAIKGTIVGGTSNTIYNLYTEFGVSQQTDNYALDTASTDVAKLIRGSKRHIEENIFTGSLVTNFVSLCSTQFFDKFIGHATIEEAYKYFQANNQRAGFQPLRDDLRRGFVHEGCLWIEYNASATLMGQSSATPFITAGEAYMFPVGVQDLFVNYFAPANRFDYVNTEGQEVYLFEYNDPKGQFVDLDSESNPLPICTRPQAVVKLTDA